MAGKNVYAKHGVAPGSAMALHSAVARKAGESAAALSAAPTRPHVVLSGDLKARDSLSALRAKAPAPVSERARVRAAIRETVESIRDTSGYRSKRRETAESKAKLADLLAQRQKIATTSPAALERAGQGDLFGGFRPKPAPAPVKPKAPREPIRAKFEADERGRSMYVLKPHDTATVKFRGDTYEIRKDSRGGHDAIGGRAHGPSTSILKNGRRVEPSEVPVNIRKRADALIEGGQRREMGLKAKGAKGTKGTVGATRVKYTPAANGSPERLTIPFRGDTFTVTRANGEMSFTKNGKAIEQMPAAAKWHNAWDAAKSKHLGIATPRAAMLAQRKAGLVENGYTVSASHFRSEAAGHSRKAAEHVREARIARAQAKHNDALAARHRENGNYLGRVEAEKAATTARNIEKSRIGEARMARSQSRAMHAKADQAARSEASLSPSVKARLAYNDAAYAAQYGASAKAAKAPYSPKPIPKGASLPRAYRAPAMNPSTPKRKVAGPGTVSIAKRGEKGDYRENAPSIASAHGFHLQGDRSKGYHVTDAKSGMIVTHLRVNTKEEALNAFKGMSSGKTLARAASIAERRFGNVGHSTAAIGRYNKIVEHRANAAEKARKAASGAKRAGSSMSATA